MIDLAVIGGGASGLMAAISFKKLCPHSHVAIFERLERVGKKIAVTGNGRCNITNSTIEPKYYHGAQKEFCSFALEQFGFKEAEQFFNDIGVVFKTEQGGKTYPYSLQASSVVDALRFCADSLGIITETGTEILSIVKQHGLFELCSASNKYTANSVIVAAGGKAGGKIATDSGYALLQKLHHTLVPLSPAIVQVKTENEYTKQLKGVKVNASVTLINCKNAKSDFGEVLFCDYGLSGPPILQLSRYMSRGTVIALDIMPEYTFEELKKLISLRADKLKNISCGDFFCGMLQKRIGQVVLKMNGYGINDSASFSQEAIKNVAKTIKNFSFKFVEKGGFQNAQVTHGGIATNEFDPKTMMSYKTDGLFAAGEVLDIDGDCGGYNLQWAWSSGNLAGKSAAEYIRRKK